MLLVRRRAPEGSYFQDGDRAAGVFGVLATGFAVLLGFVVFLAFESYDTSRSGAETEAELVVQQFETAQFFPPRARDAVGRARLLRPRRRPQRVAGDAATALGDIVNPWGVAMFRTLQTVEPQSASEQAAYSKWFDQRSDRESARVRPHARRGGRDPAAALDRAVPQRRRPLRASCCSSPTARSRVRAGGDDRRASAIVITSTLLLLWFLDNPYHAGVGGLKPVAMVRTLGADRPRRAGRRRPRQPALRRARRADG